MSTVTRATASAVAARLRSLRIESPFGVHSRIKAEHLDTVARRIADGGGLTINDRDLFESLHRQLSSSPEMFRSEADLFSSAHKASNGTERIPYFEVHKGLLAKLTASEKLDYAATKKLPDRFVRVPKEKFQ